MPTGEAVPDTAVGVQPAGASNSNIAAAELAPRRPTDTRGVASAGGSQGQGGVMPIPPELVEVFPLERHLAPDERGPTAETVGGAAHAAALTPFSRVVARLTIRQGLWLLILQCLGAALLDFAINLLIHWAVYNNSDPIHLWQLPNSIAGDFAVTLIVQTILTWIIGGIVAWRDLWLRTVAPLAPPLRPVFLQRAASRDVVLVHPIALQKRKPNDPRRRPEQNATLLRLAAPPVRGRAGPFSRLLAWFLATPDVAHAHVTYAEPVGGPRARVHVCAHAQALQGGSLNQAPGVNSSTTLPAGGSTQSAAMMGQPVDLIVPLPAPSEAVIVQAANEAAAAGYERMGPDSLALASGGSTAAPVAAEPVALRARHRGEGGTADEREPLSPPSGKMPQAPQAQAATGTGAGMPAGQSAAAQRSRGAMVAAPPPLHIHPERYTYAVPITRGKPRFRSVAKGLCGLALRGLLVAVILFPFLWGIAIAITAGIWGK